MLEVDNGWCLVQFLQKRVAVVIDNPDDVAQR